MCLAEATLVHFITYIPGRSQKAATLARFITFKVLTCT